MAEQFKGQGANATQPVQAPRWNALVSRLVYNISPFSLQATHVCVYSAFAVTLSDCPCTVRPFTTPRCDGLLFTFLLIYLVFKYALFLVGRR